MATRIHFIDIYVLSDDIDADIIENILTDYDIACVVKEFDKATDTIDRGETVEKRIAVEEDKVERAKKLINDAIRNGIISDDGTFET